MIVKHSQRVLFNRITSGMLSILLVIGTVLNPVTMLPAFATDNLIKLNYENHNKKDVELYVQADEVNYRPGDEMELTLYVQNNSDEALKGIGLSWDGDKDAFAEAEFIGAEELGAEINEKGNVVNLNLEAGEVVAIDFAGTLSDDLDDLNRKEISFFYGAETESGENVTDRTSFEFTVGLFNELSMEFVDGNELIPDETAAIDIKMSFNDLGYYYEAEVEEEEIVEVATDSNTIVATDSNTETATDSDAELATDSNSDEEEVVVATDSNTEDEVEIATDSDSEEEDEDEPEEYVFEITGLSLNLDTYGAEFKNVVLKDTVVTEGKAEIETTALFELDDDAEVGEYFGTLQAVVKSGKKEFKAEIGFQFEVVDETITTGFKKHGLFTAELDNFTVNVQVPRGAFDEKVELSVTELAEDSEEFKTAEEAMEASEREFDGMMALDICFLNKAGEEVEPKEGYNVQVSIEMNADVLPEGTDTESLMVHHIAETTTDDVEAEVELVVEDVADTADATDGIVEVKEDAEEAVVAAEFSVESFSKFVISWNNNNTSVQVVYCDSNGEITLNGYNYTTVQINNTNFNLNTYAPQSAIGDDNNTYGFVKAELLDDEGSIIRTYDNVGSDSFKVRSEGRYYNSTYYLQYSNDDAQFVDIPENYKINLVYEKLEPLTTFQGVDTNGLIDIHLTNFDSGDKVSDDSEFIITNSGGINEWTGNGSGVRQGIVEKTLNGRGYPTVVADGDSLEKFFAGGKNANHLFQLDSKGYYYYDSDLNAAYLNGNSFDLYTAPHAKGGFDSGSVPQFMPYNQMNSTIQNAGSGDGSYRYYPFKSSEDYYFGMTVDFQFLMPKDGQVNIKDSAGNVVDSEDMVFEFTGDDDVWVFIDNVLVLDLGGVHLKSGGRINFATGEVTVDKVFAGDKNSANGPIVKDLYQLYDDAEAEENIVWVTNDEGEKIYKDYTLHTLKFFYMERGAGGSNCKLRFNIPAIPKNSLRIEKQLTDSASIEGNVKTYIENSVDYQFKVLKAGTDDTPYFPVGTKYKVYTGNTYESKELKENGIITLKAGQYALFEDMLKYNKVTDKGEIIEYYDYYVRELMDDPIKGQYEDIIFTINGNGGSVIPEEESGKPLENFNDYRTPDIDNDQSRYVVFSNKVDVDELSMLAITKKIAPNSNIAANEQFKFEVKLGNDETSLVSLPANTPYMVGDDELKTDENGYITLSEGKTAILVAGILAGTHYQISEVITKDVEGNPRYSASYEGSIGKAANSSDATLADAPKAVIKDGNTIGMAGSVTMGDVVSITVTNAKNDFYKELSLNKTTVGFNKVDTSSTFEFEVTPCTVESTINKVSIKNLIEEKKYVGCTIEVDPHTDNTKTVNGDLVIRGELDSTNTIYYFAVTEVKDAHNIFVKYDASVYVLEVEVKDGLTTVKRVAKNGEWLDTVPTLEYTNTYQDTTSITIKKDVTGNMGDVNKWFEFTATLSTGTFPASAEMNDATSDAYVADGSSATFKLKDDGAITISEIPVGATITINENNCKGYTVTATDSGSKTTPTITMSSDGNIATLTTTAAIDASTIVFTNHKDAIIDTGISMDTLPYILIMLAVIGGIAFTIIRRRKEDDLD